MKDLRIVIVSWNVEAVIERCLLSLPAACRGLDWEAVIVDNASTDASCDIIQRACQQSSAMRLIKNASNLGFGKACNIGTVGFDARYVLYLNPDTECPPQSLATFVKAADECPEAAILGPKLVYPDGRTQSSVRGFPDVWSQAGILLKLHHLVPKLGSFRRYFGADVDLEAEQVVDQVMGACFLVRRAFLEQTGGFDERYFIWFEEVDWCKTAVTNGWEVRYLPQVSVIHHLGSSFRQVFSVQKQRYFQASMRSYFAKWHPGWPAVLISILGPLSIALAWLINLFAKPAAQWASVIIALEVVSAATIFHPVANSVATFTLGVLVLLLAWKKPVPALGILLLEVLIGSKGQLWQFGFWPVTTSVRIIVTMAFLAGWVMDVLQRRRWKDVARLMRGRMQYAALFLLIGYAVLMGIDRQNGALTFEDANAWFDWLLLFPILDVVTRHAQKVKTSLAVIFPVALLWLALKHLGLEYLFSHGFSSISPDAYLWVRRTGVGEVTHVIANAFRIFMQSDVYATAGFIMASAYLFTRSATGDASGNFFASRWTSASSQKVFRAAGPVAIAFALMTGSAFILANSLSRSFWIGTAVGGVTLLVLLTMQRVAWWKHVFAPIAASVTAIVIFAAVIAFPIPRVDSASLLALFGSRTNVGDEAAAASRWNLLPALEHKIAEHPILGSGFGATVTYQSKDPRIVAENKTGVVTTYAFEWGWLEHWVKFGILGIPVMLWVLISLGWRMWKDEEQGRETGVSLPLWFRAGFVASLVALAVLHIFTPYLNHPLGFLYFFVGEAILLMRYESKKSIS